MAVKSSIGYIDSSINPIRGCGGCELWNLKTDTKICYAGRMISRWAGKGSVWPDKFTEPIFVNGQLEKTYRWPDLTNMAREGKPWIDGYPRVIFVNDMSDSWTEAIWKNGTRSPLPVDWLADYMDDLIASPHIYMLLTKRPARAVEFFKNCCGYIPSNFWVGTSVTGPETFSRAVELARLAPICYGRLWLSLEPLYNKVGLSHILPEYDWTVVGGESGPGSTAMGQNTLNQVISDCAETNTPLFVKQLGGPKKGEDWGQWQDALKIRQMPRLHG